MSNSLEQLKATGTVVVSDSGDFASKSRIYPSMFTELSSVITTTNIAY